MNFYRYVLNKSRNNVFLLVVIAILDRKKKHDGLIYIEIGG